MSRKLDIFQPLHDPCYVRHFLAYIMESDASPRQFLQSVSVEDSLTLIHQCAIELAFHPHLPRAVKSTVNATICEYIRQLSPDLRIRLVARLEFILDRLMIFAGQDQDLSFESELSATQLVVWFHDQIIDSIFGLDHRQLKRSQTAKATSYLDFYCMMLSLPAESRCCDLGCGMGRSLLLAAAVFPQLEPIDVECCQSCTQVLKRAMLDLGLSRIRLHEIDLASKPIP